MRKILALLLFCLPSLGAEGIKISDLPLLGGASVDAIDSFPALDASAGRTVRIRVGDLFLVPSLAAQLAPFAGKMANPMTTLGDIIYGGAAGAPTRLAAGTLGYVLTSNGPGVAPSYQANPAGGITGLTNEVIASGSGSVSATVTNSAVIGKLLTGFVPGAGAVAATDTVLQGFNKVVGNMALLAPLDSPTFTGTVTTSSISGVNVTGGSLSIQGGYSDTGNGGNLSFYGGTGHAGDGSQDGTVSLNSGNKGIQVSPAGTQVTGDIAATSFSGPLTGNVNGNASGSCASITGNLTGPVTSVGMATSIVDAHRGFFDGTAISDKCYTVDESAPYPYTINSYVSKSTAGTVTIAAKINGSSITGISSCSVTSVQGTCTATAANSVATGNRVEICASSTSSAANVAWTMKFTR